MQVIKLKLAFFFIFVMPVIKLMQKQLLKFDLERKQQFILFIIVFIFIIFIVKFCLLAGYAGERWHMDKQDRERGRMDE